MKAAGADIVQETAVNNNQGDYSTEIVKMESAGAQVVLIWENALAAEQIIQQSHNQGYAPKWLLFPFNLTLKTLNQAGVDTSQMEGIVPWPAYTCKASNLPEYSPYRAEIEKFEAAYKQYDSGADLCGDGGDLLFGAWEAWEQVADLLYKCGPQCDRNRVAGVLLNGYHATVGANCPVDFHNGDGHHGGGPEDLYRVTQINGNNAWYNTGFCETTIRCVPADLAAAGWSNEPSGTHVLCSYSTQGLTRSYWVYQPPTWSPADSWPLIVVLHGCTEQGPDIAAISRFDWEAEQRHFLVAYPNQAGYTMTGTTTFDGNGSHCWNWFLPQGQERGAGEPALIAGITRSVIAADNVDPHRVDVIGISAGGATADIMAATYPDLYAAAGILAGCEYKGLPCLGSAAELPPQVSGQLAYQASQGHARVVPFLVENGDTDPAVPLPNAVEVTQQWQVTDDLAAHHGTASSPVSSPPCAHQSVVPSSPVDTS
ncbi:MAG: hypothetical protein E6J20_21170, partial [Chloroflexi bacterium]